jgi:NADH dehydrogenase
VVPLREELRTTELRVGSVLGADPDRDKLLVAPLEADPVELDYDHLIVALGSVSRALPIPGLSEHATGFKTLPEAIALRNRLLRTLEVADSLDRPEDRQAYLTYVFVGAGYAGVEGLAELQDLAADVIDRYPRARLQGMRWVLIEARDRIMTEVSARLSDFAVRELMARGIEVRTGTTIAELDASGVRLSTGEVIPTRMVVWTAGVEPHPAVARLGLPLGTGGRIRVDRFMRVEGHPRVWAIGDAAAVPDPSDLQRPSPPTAQHAIRQGRRVADNVAAALGSGRARPFRYRTLGVFVDLGRHKAVATTLGIRWRGFPAWLLARTYHLAMMPGLKRKLRLLTDWNVGLLFGRDSSELGQLGHPARLGETLDVVSSGGTALAAGGDGAPPATEAAGAPPGAGAEEPGRARILDPG